MIKDHTAKISKDTLLVLILNSVNYLCSFIMAVLVSRFLGIESFGQYSFIFAFILIPGIVADFGLSTLIVRKINENKFIAKELIFNFNVIKIFLSIAIIIILTVPVYLFFEKFFYPAFIIGIMIILPRSLMSTYESSLRSFMNQGYPVTIKSINSFLQLTFSYFLLTKGFGLTEIFLGVLLLDSLTALVLYITNGKVIKNYYAANEEYLFVQMRTDHKFRFIPVIKESSVFFLNNFFMISIKGMNVILLGYFSTAVSVGIYSAGARFVNGIGLFSGALFNSFYPAISNIKNDARMKVNLTKRFLIYSFVLGFIISGAVFFLADQLIEMTFRSAESVIVLKILSLTMLPVLVYTVTQSFLFTVYEEKFLMKILIIAWSLNIILSIILITLYDYTGCAAALAFTEIFLMLTQLHKFISDVRKFETVSEIA